MIRRPPRSTQSRSSAASDVYKRQSLVADGTLAFAEPVERPGPTSLVPATMRPRIQSVTHRGAGPFRDAEGLRRAVEVLAATRAKFHTTTGTTVVPQVAEWETSNVLGAASLIAAAALTRCLLYTSDAADDLLCVDL